MDPLADFILQKIEKVVLCDITPSTINPTRRNNRERSGGISKRLDRFLIKLNIVDNMGRTMTLINDGEVSNHIPIFLSV